MPSLNLTQFAQTNAVGALSRGPQPATFSVQIDPTSVATPIQVASVVKLVSYANGDGPIIVDTVEAQGDGLPFGVIFLNTKKNIYVAGDMVEICAVGNTLWLEAAGAITRGATVAVTTNGDGGPAVESDVTSGHNVLGIAMTQPTTAGDLVLVLVQPRLLP